MGNSKTTKQRTSARSNARSNNIDGKRSNSDRNSKEESSAKRSKKVTPVKSNKNNINLEETDQLTTRQVRSNYDYEAPDEDTDTDLSQNDEELLVPDVHPYKTNLEIYFRKRFDCDTTDNRSIKDMVTICDNQYNEISYIGMCKTIVKVHKKYDAIKHQLLTMRSSSEIVKNKHMAKVNDLKEFLKVKVVNLFRYKFIMVS